MHCVKTDQDGRVYIIDPSDYKQKSIYRSQQQYREIFYIHATLRTCKDPHLAIPIT